MNDTQVRYISAKITQSIFVVILTVFAAVGLLIHVFGGGWLADFTVNLIILLEIFGLSKFLAITRAGYNRRFWEWIQSDELHHIDELSDELEVDVE